MLIGLVVAAVLTVGAAVKANDQPEACLAYLANEVGALPSVSSRDVLVGRWNDGGMLSGGSLYLFEDQTYLRTVWMDILPETLVERGSWLWDATSVMLEPALESPRHAVRSRYALLRMTPGDKKYLLSLTNACPRLQQEGEADHSDAEARRAMLTVRFTVVAMSRELPWKVGHGPRFKRDLMKTLFRAAR